MSTLSEGTRIGDLVKIEFDQRYNRKIVALDKSVAVEIGSPIDQNGSNSRGSLVTNGNEANVDAISLQKLAADSSNYLNCLCLVRGPAMIDKNLLDLQASVTAAELEPYLAALGITYMAEPTSTTTMSG